MDFIPTSFRYIFFIFFLIITSCKPSSHSDSQNQAATVASHFNTHEDESLYFGEGYSVLNQKGVNLFVDTFGNSPSELSSNRIKENLGFETLPMSHFNHGLAVVMIKNKQGGLKWAYINKKGENPFGKSFSYAGEFDNEQAIIKENDFWGIIDQQGNYLIEPEYDGVSQIIDNNVWIKKGAAWKYVSYPDMVQVLDGLYQIYGESYEGTFWVDQSDEESDVVRRAYANKNGEIISPWFSNATNFSEGLAAFEQNGKWGFIDKDGNIIIAPQFEYASRFSEGLAAFTTFSDEGFGEWGYINKKGEVVIPMTYKFASDFKNGFAEVRDKNGTRGFIDKKGKIIVDYQYELSYNFHENLAAVKKNDKWGFINTKGEVVIPLKFDNVLNFLDFPFEGGFSNGIAKVQVDGYDFFIDKQGNCAVGCLE